MRRLVVVVAIGLIVVGVLEGGWGQLDIAAQDATPTSELEANKALARRFHEELFNQGNMAAAQEILAPDFAWYDPPNETMAEGPEGATQVAADTRAFYPDLVLTEDDIIAEGDRVVIRWTLRGTASYGTGGMVEVTGIDIFRIENGQLVELWQLFSEEQRLNQQPEEIPATPIAGTPTT